MDRLPASCTEFPPPAEWALTGELLRSKCDQWAEDLPHTIGSGLCNNTLICIINDQAEFMPLTNHDSAIWTIQTTVQTWNPHLHGNGPIRNLGQAHSSLGKSPLPKQGAWLHFLLLVE